MAAIHADGAAAGSTSMRNGISHHHDLDLDLDLDRSQYLGPSHRACNRGTNGRRRSAPRTLQPALQFFNTEARKPKPYNGIA